MGEFELKPCLQSSLENHFSPETLSTLCEKILNHAIHATVQILTKFKTERVALKGTPLPAQPAGQPGTLRHSPGGKPYHLQLSSRVRIRTRKPAGRRAASLALVSPSCCQDTTSAPGARFRAPRSPGTGRLPHDTLGAQQGRPNPQFS